MAKAPPFTKYKEGPETGREERREPRLLQQFERRKGMEPARKPAPRKAGRGR